MIDSDRVESRITIGMAIKEVLVIALIVFAYVVDIPVIILIGFVLACLLVCFSSCEDSIYLLAFFTPFSGIFVYEGRHMFFVMVALFIIKFLLSGKIGYKTIMYYLIIVVYCLLFCDIQGDFSFAKLIGLILLFAIPVVGAYSDRINGKVFFGQYIFGFAIQTIIGFFATKIPAIMEIFETDTILLATHSQMTRFFGLAFDSNFYAMSNYVVVAYLLFGFKKMNMFRALLTVFFVISGLMTVSKSYFLVLIGLLLLFFVQKMKQPRHYVIVLCGGILAIGLFVFVSNKIGYNVIDLVTDRFVLGGSFAENTTGRVDIWKHYLDIFMNANLKELILGFGFNAKVERAAHNTFIELLFYYGIVGFGIWMAYFSYCFKLFLYKTRSFPNKTMMVTISLMMGILFLSAYTYESFWISVVFSFMTLGKTKGRRGAGYAL